MPIQQARHANLSALVESLRASGISTTSGQVRILGPALNERRLSRMLAGSAVPSLTARCIEHRLGKPKGWMDSVDAVL